MCYCTCSVSRDVSVSPSQWQIMAGSWDHAGTKVNMTRFCRILTICFSEIRQQIRVTRELLDQTALKTILLKKQINITHAVLEFCTGRFVTSSPWESTLRNNLNKRKNLIAALFLKSVSSEYGKIWSGALLSTVLWVLTTGL